MRWRVLIAPLAAIALLPATAHAQASPAERDAVQQAYVAGDFTRAEQLLAGLLAENPRDPDLLRRRAAVEAAREDLDAAQATIDEATALAPNDPDIRLARANILFWRGDYAAAEAETDRLAVTHPDYPGLERVSRSIRRASNAGGVRLRSVAVGGSLSDAEFVSGLQQAWYVQRGSASVQWDQNNIATVGIESEQRLQTDTRISGRFDFAGGSNRYYVSSSFTPDPDFRESWSVGAGAVVPLGASTTLQLDGHFADYRTDDVVALSTGLRRNITTNVEVTARSIILLGGGEDFRLGGSLRGDYRIPGVADLFVIAASYPDAEIDGTRQLRALAGGARFALTDRLALGVTGEYERREDSYQRKAVTLDLRWLFGGG